MNININKHIPFFGSVKEGDLWWRKRRSLRLE
jgi:hypothetical protein